MKNPIVRISLLAVALAGLAACSDTGTKTVSSKAKPATVEKIEGTDLKRVVLVEKAAKRLDLQTATVREASAPDVVAAIGASPAGRTVLPYAGLLYDKSGATFTYISGKPLEFVRQPVTVERIKSDLVVLSAGPPAGTTVVTTGGAEIFGAETGVGK